VCVQCACVCVRGVCACVCERALCVRRHQHTREQSNCRALSRTYSWCV
jgi:hypothetical protein